MAPARKRRPSPKAAPLPLEALSRLGLTIDLHGMYVRQALEALEAHLRRCHSANAPAVHVVHGHGSGALKAAVRRYLDGHPLVDKSYPAAYGDGGDGVTIAELDIGDRRARRRRSHDSRPLPPPDRRG